MVACTANRNNEELLLRRNQGATGVCEPIRIPVLQLWFSSLSLTNYSSTRVVDSQSL